ncbi:DNA translocase FtsK [Candidatus Marinimicrobia bacterium]|nr:DNA translocase FtsK [Candidatus Neomarinimicrobiota bacterium]
MNNFKNETISILLFTVSLFIFLSLLTFNTSNSIYDFYNLFYENNNIFSNTITGALGSSVSALLQKNFLGYGSFSICSILFMYSYIIFTRKDYKLSKYSLLSLYQLGLGLWVSIFCAWYFDSFPEASGMIGYVFHHFLSSTISSFIYFLLPIAFLLLLRGIFNWSIYDFMIYIKQKILNIKGYKRKDKNLVTEVSYDDESNIDILAINEIKIDTTTIDEGMDSINANDDEKEIIIEEEQSISELDIDLANKEYNDKYKLPSSNLLNEPVESLNELSQKQLEEKGEQLVSALQTFGVEGLVKRITRGPIITLFEIEPADGVRVNKFTTLSDDLARIMQVKRIRIIAPIPGTSSVGIELPNANPKTVFLKTILNSEEYVNSESPLTIAIGKTTTGGAYTIDLDKLPHLLVAGATGAGKSVCINTIIMSILYKAKPDEVKFVLIDPKKLELSNYKKLVGYHLITSPNLDEYVMTTAENAVGILNAAIYEMEKRFSVFAEAGVRNISEYHQKYLKNKNSMEKVPYVVVLIDELADLMMTSSRAIEEPITRLAQKARAVGIHLVVATQRPSVDVITGLIKSNFPARISFQVSSRIDSRTIIDQMGAEKLLGNGDMLFLAPGSASPIRLHNAYITLDEIEKVLNHISNQPKPDELKLPEVKKSSINSDSSITNIDSDELLIDAAKLVVDTGQASVSLLQRRFRIGYSRAGRLIDELESLGIVSGHSGSKAREVLVDHIYLDSIFNQDD